MRDTAYAQLYVVIVMYGVVVQMYTTENAED